MEETIGLGPDTKIDAPVNLQPPEADLPDTHGADVAPSAPAPVQSLPDTHGADQALPTPSATEPHAPTQTAVDPIAARPGDPNQTPVVPSSTQSAGAEWRKGAMDPRRIHNLFEEEVTKQGLVGVVPADGAKYGIRTGSAKEWANFLTGLAAHESGLKNETVGDVGQFRGGSRGLLQLSYDDAPNYGLNGGQPFTPEQLADPAQNAAAGVAIIKKLVGDAGSIQRGAGKYWGPISKEGWTPGNGRDRDLPWAELGAIPSTGPVNLKTDLAPAFAPAGTPEAAVEANKIAAYRPSPTLWRTVEAAADETTAAYLFRDSPVFAPAPDYKPTAEELDARKQGLPEKYWDRLIGVSPAHSDYLTTQAKRQFENEVTLSEAGWTGVGIGLVSSILDPVDLSVGIASGGLGAFAGGAMKAGAIGQRLMAAGGAAAGNAGLTALGDAAGRATEGSDYAYAAAWGAGLGFAFGPLARNPATQDIADAGAYAANRARAGIERGAAGDLSAAETAGNTLEFSNGPLARMGQEDASNTAISQLRPDMAGRAGSSPNPVTRIMGALFGFDAVGRVGPNGERVVNSQSVGEMAAIIRSGWHNRVYSAVYPQFDEWAKANGFTHFWQRQPGIGKAWEQFAEEVYRYRADRLPDRDSRYSKQAAFVDKALTAAYNDHLKGHVDPRFDTPNNPGRPLAGMDAVPENPHYAPRKWRADKINAFDASGRKFRDWLEGALLSGHPELGDKAGTIARGMHKNLVGRAFNVDEFQMVARNGATADVLESYMRQLDIPDADIADILSRLPKGTKPDFAHFKLDIDEGFIDPRTGARITDFVETNAFELFDHYNHQSSAWRALGRAQAVDGNGKVLLDGIRSVPEFEKAVQQLRSRGFEAGQTPKQIDNDASLIQEMFDRVRGVPHTAAGGTVDQLLEAGRNTATMLFAGSFGLAALADAGRLAALGGIRAMLQHMPAFRTDIVEGGVLRPRNALTQDLQAAFAYADEFRPFSPRWDAADERMAGPMEGFLGKVVGATRVGAEAVIRLSGMPAINRRLKEAASGIMAQRLYNDVKRALDTVIREPGETLPEHAFAVYHGSPHEFDSFSLGKIGAGEGTQFEGHGLYFAEKEGTAQWYQNSYKSPAIQAADGSLMSLDNGDLPNAVRQNISDIIGNTKWPVEERRSRAVRFLGHYLDHAAKTLENEKFWADAGNANAVSKAAKLEKEMVAMNHAIDVLNRMEDGASFTSKSHLYEARVMRPKDEFLDLDAPLSEQSPKVWEALQRLGADAPSEDMTGAELLDQLARDYKPEGAAQKLSDVGIAGTQYFDGRSKDGLASGSIQKDKASRNFVVFNDADVKTFARDGIQLLKLADGREVPVFDLSRLSNAERDRMKWFGLDDEMLSRVMAQLHDNATAKQGILGEAITGFNPGNWTDPEALNAFVNAIRRGANRAVMEHDLGSGTVFDRSPVFKTFTQLRRFALNAWHMNILHGAHMRDGEAFADVVWATAAAATLYAVRTRIQAGGQEDPEKFLKERFAPGAFATATFQLSAYSSLIPTIVDTFGMNAIGANPLFGYRTSGLPSNALFGNPSFAAADAFLQAPGALLRPLVQGRERSQQEWKQMLAVVPFQNNFLVQQGFSRMIHGAPQRPPKGPGYSISDLLMNSVD